MMRKMKAGSLVDLVNMAARLRPPSVPEAEMQPLRDRYASLSRREREVMALVVAGRLNKQIGGELGICEITVQAHRGRVMRKMRADSLAGLVNIAARLRFTAAPKG
jgi:FixJ family two-component response regulator